MTRPDFLIFAITVGSLVFFGGMAVLALSWSVREGQFRNLEHGSQTIFDPDEPIGEVTDRFPSNEE